MLTIPQQQFTRRRQALADLLQDNSLLIVPAAQFQTRSNDTEYPFRQSSDFHYLTNFPEAEAWLVIEKNTDEITSTLYCLPKDKTIEIWSGKRIGKQRAIHQFGFDEAEEIAGNQSALAERFKKLLLGKEYLYWAQGADSVADTSLFSWLNEARKQTRKSGFVPDQIIDYRPLLHDMRLFKTAEEISLMREASRISSQAHHRAMQFSAEQCRHNSKVAEYQIEAEIAHECAMQGARFPAYNSIVGGGENACILHYTENSAMIEQGQLVLIDAGFEIQGYAADITRAFPVSGVFSDEQKALYELVLSVQEQAIAEIKPGITLKQVSEQAIEKITQGLLDLGILHLSEEQSLADLIKSQAYKAYYMHGLSHWLGLDVHDVGSYQVKGEDRVLEAGMVFTVEPGIYIDSDAECDSKWHGIGIRIEDNILVTETGHENLTTAVKSVADIEALMAGTT